MSSFQMPIKKPDPIYFFDVDIEFSLGFVANLDETGETDNSVWIGLIDQENYKKYIGKLALTHKNINVEILVNQESIFNKELTGALPLQQVNYKFKFFKETVSNLLNFKITGFLPAHMLLLPNGLGARPAIKIEKINFEEVNVITVFTEFSTFTSNNKTIGDYIFTCNGVSSFEFNTPIYKWLIDHREIISY